MIPLVHDFAGETVLVFGGGPVGARKARRFAGEARVVVVSPEFAHDDYGGAERVRAAPDEAGVGAWLDRIEPALAVAATDERAVNAAIERAAEDRRILVNRVDVAGPRSAGSVVVPATVRDGPVLLAVSTEGAAPALSRGLRIRLEEHLAGSEQVAEALVAVDDVLAGRGLDTEVERLVRRMVASSSAVWEAAADGESDVVAMATAMAEAADLRPAPGGP